MTRTLFSTTIALALTAALPNTSSANDIVDFLRAVSGRPQVQYGHRGNHHRHDVIQPVSRRSSRGHDLHGHADSHRAVDLRHLDRRSNGRYRSARPVSIGRSGVSFSVSLGNVAPPPPIIPVAPAPNFGSYGHLPHQIGSIVTCPVPLETCVHVNDVHRIAPGAIPIVVAVRSPHLGRFGSCVEQLAYVEVLVPPCPLRRARVSPCKTKVRLDYGRYEVDIVSRNGVIEIDYDN